jgi:predicted regulator of Ras-like GTPase activity (Roadblock/LC7/MglB family)
MPILTVEAAQRLTKILDEFVDRSEASFAVLLDRGGTILSEFGALPSCSTDVNVVAALAAGSFAATRELALRIGEPEFSALYQQGANWHMLISAVDDDSVLVTVFGKQTTVGLVKFYSASAVLQVAAVLQELRAGPRFMPRFTEEDVRHTGSIFSH